MNDLISIRVPFERGTQLRDLAEAKGITVTDAIGLLLDHAARTGLEIPEMPGFDITINDERTHVVMVIGKIGTTTLSVANARSVAENIRVVASGRRHATLDMDCVNPLEISRAGAAVVITIRGEHGVVVKKTISCGVAIAVADRLEQGADFIDAEEYGNVTLANIRQLVGDLEAGTP